MKHRHLKYSFRSSQVLETREKENSKEELSALNFGLRTLKRLKSVNRSLFMVLFFSSLSFSSFAQKTQVRISETEVNIQKIYIEANKEKLLGNDQDAIILFSEVIRKQPNNDAAAYELGKLYTKTGNKEKALSYAKKSMELAPDNIWYATKYAEILAENNSYDEAAAIFEGLTEIYPEQPEFYFEQAYMLVKANKTTEAIKIYEVIEEKIGVEERTSKRKYALYLMDGKTKKAEAELLKLTKTYPTDVSFLQILAEFYEQYGKKEDAKKTYQSILKLDPEDAVANLALAETIKASGNEGQYLTALEELFKKPEVSLDLKIKELVPYIRKMPEFKNQSVVRQQILDLGETLTAVHTTEAKAFSVYGDLLYHADENEKALAAYEKTLKLDPSVFMVWEQMMTILADLGQGEKLLKTAEEAMDLYPNQAVVYLMSGRGQALQKNHSAAVSDLEQALMMSARDKAMKNQIYAELGKSYFFLKEYKKSDNAFEMALEINPRDAVTLNNYSYLLCERGENLDKALQMSNSANQLLPNNPIFMGTYGRVLYKSNDFEMAERWIKKAIDFGDNSPNTLEHYGDALFQLNKVSEAVEYWQKAQEKGSISPLLDKKIADKKLYE